MKSVPRLVGIHIMGTVMNPGHQTAYLFAYSGAPWRTQQWVREIMKRSYQGLLGGLSGNDDAGQMSGRFIFNSLGFYPVTPASNTYVIGSPSVKKATIHLSNGNDFTMRAKSMSDKNIYIQSATLNGNDWNKPYIIDEAVESGGTLEFTMGAKPNKS